MFSPKRFKLKKLKNIFEKLPRILAEHIFLTILGLLFLSLFLGAIVFYQYNVLMLREIPEAVEKPLTFKEKTYQKVLEFWQEREKRFKATDLKEYLDPFREIKKELPIPVSEEVQEIPEIGFYIISRGETLWELAEKYLGSGKRWREIKTEDGQAFTKSSAEVIPIGQKLIIPRN